MSIAVDLRKSIGGFALDAAFESAGHVTALFGRSGAGKTTLVNLIAGLARPDRGFVRLGGETLSDVAAGTFVPPHRRRIGYVFQEGRLFPHLTVRGNLRYGERSAPERRVKLGPIVELLGIGHLLDRRPASLSGGEKQRVAIGRALMTSPRLLLMDEPLAAIDRPRRAEILPYLDRLRAEMAIPIVYVSHSVEEIARIADMMVVLDDGKVVRIGPTADILSRLDLAALDGGEPGVILSGTVVSIDKTRGIAAIDHAAGRIIAPAPALPAGAAARIRVHARDVAIAVGEPGRISIRNRLPAKIAAICPQGGGVDVRLNCGGEALLARLTADAVEDLGLAEGSEVTALIKAVAVEGY